MTEEPKSITWEPSGVLSQYVFHGITVGNQTVSLEDLEATVDVLFLPAGEIGRPEQYEAAERVEAFIEYWRKAVDAAK